MTTDTNQDTLGTALPKELARCQELLAQYAAIGPAAQFSSIMIKGDIAKAHKAMMEGDVIAMLVAYKTLQGWRS